MHQDGANVRGWDGGVPFFGGQTGFRYGIVVVVVVAAGARDGWVEVLAEKRETRQKGRRLLEKVEMEEKQDANCLVVARCCCVWRGCLGECC